MKLLHIADLHLGKAFHKINLIKDQEYMIHQILDLMDREKANLVIAGDVFDSSNPSLEAQELFLAMMLRVSELCQRNQKCCWIIVGNHDSNRRLLLWKKFLQPEIQIIDEFYRCDYEDASFFFLSFVKPTSAQLQFDRYFDTYGEAYAAYIKDLDIKDRTVLVTHQTFENVTTGKSEAISFFDGAIPLSVVEDFPLVLAGHIHKKQTIRNVFYSGSLLPYAFGDLPVTTARIWDICTNPEEDVRISFQDYPVRCLHELQVIRGDMDYCLSIEDIGAFVKVELVDDSIDIDMALTELKRHFKNLVTVTSGTETNWDIDFSKPETQFHTFDEALDSFCNQIEIPIFSNEQMKIIKEVLDEITNATD